ncbi:MAG: helix-turn-helix transcriptional regulator [Spirochaetaceae bacterium]|jgi:ribosome-binding protein aMBF1 (putative translation factor)|nr:helix-turn-helix transcriptional regulator [Spirochaetaceae bacterium]
MIKTSSFEKDLKERLKSPTFKKAYDDERRIITLATEIAESREHAGMSQRELAAKSGISQQQVSRVESGANCNLLTFVRLTSALGLKVRLSA